jgi:hypothetical protein
LDVLVFHKQTICQIRCPAPPLSYSLLLKQYPAPIPLKLQKAAESSSEPPYRQRPFGDWLGIYSKEAPYCLRPRIQMQIRIITA